MNQHEPRHNRDHDFDETTHEPWHPRHGRLMKTMIWLVLIGFSAVVLIMIAIVIYEGLTAVS